MTKQLQQTFEAAQNLSPTELYQLLQLISEHLLSQPYQPSKPLTIMVDLLEDILHENEPQPTDQQFLYTTRNGVPLFPIQPNASNATLALVNELRDERP